MPVAMEANSEHDAGNNEDENDTHVNTAGVFFKTPSKLTLDQNKENHAAGEIPITQGKNPLDLTTTSVEE